MKVYAALAVLALSGWLAFFLQRQQMPVVKTVTVDKIVEKVVTVDRVVNRDVVKTTVLPDGTKIVETDKSVDRSKASEKSEVKEHSQTLSAPALAKYSLGVAVRIDPYDYLKRTYEIELGRRLWTSPLWIKAAVTTDRGVSLGLALEF